MKTNILSLSILIAISCCSVFADQTPSDAQSQIGAQLGITHDSITQLLDKMDQQSQTNDGMAHADYKKKVVQENAKIKTALSVFESYLRDSLFPELRSDLVNYNSIYSSNQYSEAQKTILLSNMSQQLNSLFSDASGRYNDAVFKVLSTLGPDPKEFITQAGDCATHSHGCSGNHVGEVSDRISLKNYGKDFYESNILPSLEDQCFSRSCISLTAADEIVFLSLASDSIGAPITFQTLDGHEFIVQGASLYPDVLASGKSQQDPMLTTLMFVMGGTAFLPTKVQQLPFDINEAELSKAEHHSAF